MRPTTNLDDAELLKLGVRANGNSDKAWRILDDRLRGPLKGWLTSKRGLPPEEAADVVQDTLVQLHRHGHKFDENRASVTGFAHHIAGNLAANSARDERRRPMVRVNVIAGDDDGSTWWNRTADPSDSFDPEADLERQGIREAVEEELEELNPEQRTPVRLRLEGRSYKEIAQETGVGLGTVKSRLSRGRRKLRKRLRRRGIEPELQE